MIANFIITSLGDGEKIEFPEKTKEALQKLYDLLMQEHWADFQHMVLKRIKEISLKMRKKNKPYSGFIFYNTFDS